MELAVKDNAPLYHIFPLPYISLHCCLNSTISSEEQAKEYIHSPYAHSRWYHSRCFRNPSATYSSSLPTVIILLPMTDSLYSLSNKCKYRLKRVAERNTITVSERMCVILYLLSRYMRPEGPWQRLRRCLSNGGGCLYSPFP